MKARPHSDKVVVVWPKLEENIEVVDERLQFRSEGHTYTIPQNLFEDLRVHKRVCKSSFAYGVDLRRRLAESGIQPYVEA